MSGKIEDLTGQRFGKLIVVALARKLTDSRIIQWECRCDCGGIIFVRANNIKRGMTKSCGCIKRAYWKKRHYQVLKVSHGVSKAKAFLRKMDSLGREW